MQTVPHPQAPDVEMTDRDDIPIVITLIQPMAIQHSSPLSISSPGGFYIVPGLISDSPEWAEARDQAPRIGPHGMVIEVQSRNPPYSILPAEPLPLASFKTFDRIPLEMQRAILKYFDFDAGFPLDADEAASRLAAELVRPRSGLGALREDWKHVARTFYSQNIFVVHPTPPTRPELVPTNTTIRALWQRQNKYATYWRLPVGDVREHLTHLHVFVQLDTSGIRLLRRLLEKHASEFNSLKKLDIYLDCECLRTGAYGQDERDLVNDPDKFELSAGWQVVARHVLGSDKLVFPFAGHLFGTFGLFMELPRQGELRLAWDLLRGMLQNSFAFTEPYGHERREYITNSITELDLQLLDDEDSQENGYEQTYSRLI